MKAFLLGIISFCALGAAPLLAPTSHSVVIYDDMVPDPQNPYCASVPFQFPIPEVVCPSDGYYYQVNVTCVNICVDSYQQEMVGVYNEACEKWSHTDQEYLNDCRLAIHAYDACAARASTLYGLELCRNQMITDFNKALKRLNVTRREIKAGINIKTDIAKINFQNCSSHCCDRIAKKRKGEGDPEPK